MQNDFVVMAKPVGSRCNMRCGYCYYLEKEHPAYARMSDETLEAFIANYIGSAAGQVVSFTWHGGEPSLAGLDFYRKAVGLQKKYLPSGKTCWNSLQTNGLLLDDEWCEFLAGNKFDVGLSIDGTEAAHDFYRRDIGGGSTFARTEAALKRLQAKGIHPDLLCTVNAATVKEPLAVYRKLRSYATGWIQFIPVVRFMESGNDAIYQLTPDSVTGEAFGDFLCAVFDEWAFHDLGKTEVQIFAETALVKSGGQARLCWMSPVCGRVPVVEQDGGVYSCDHFVDAKHRIGDIAYTSEAKSTNSPLQTATLAELTNTPMQTATLAELTNSPTQAATLAELVNSPSQIKFGNDKRDGLTDRCLTCPWLKYCNGGCPKDRAAGVNVLCEGYRRFFSHADGVLDRIIALRKGGAAPAAVMSALIMEAQAKWKGVGRNAPCPCGSGKKFKACCMRHGLQ
jgi:uncharacterized protein